MSRELNKIFDVKSRQARRDILDKFDLSKEDKNKVLNKIDSAGSNGEGEGNIAGEYYALKPVEGFYPYEYNLCVVFLGLLSEVKFGEFNVIYPTARILSSYWYSHQFNSPSAVLGNTTAFCFRPIKRLIEGGDGTLYTFNTLQDALNNEEFDDETRNIILASIEPITEEEFYNLEK